MKVATFVKDMTDVDVDGEGGMYNGAALLFKVSEPIKYMHNTLSMKEIVDLLESGENFPDDQYEMRTADHIIVSAVDVPYSGPETYIFPADESGMVVSWSELEGSFRGSLDHRKALENAGYEIIEFKGWSKK